MYLFQHMGAFDRHTSKEDYETFVTAKDLDKSVITRILDNEFRNPLLESTDSEDEAAEEQERQKFNWNEFWNTVWKKRNNNFDSTRAGHTYVPGLRPVAPYLKLSSLTSLQHDQCLKVLSAENKNILPGLFLPRPSKMDHRVFEEVRELYKKEQQEYIAWAKTMWTAKHCIRALRPKPAVEAVYQAEFNMKAHEMQSFPKKYSMAAQIPLEMRNNSFEMVHQKDLITVNIKKLPQIDCEKMLRQKFTVISPIILPEPCDKHPCKFILPSEDTTSIMPLVEIHRELAQYASDNGAQYICSESTLKCLTERDRKWMIPVTVCPVITLDGERNIVIVMGSDFAIHRQSARNRTYRAFRHLLENSLVTRKDEMKLQKENCVIKEIKRNNTIHSSNLSNLKPTLDDSDDEEEKLIIADDMIESNPRNESVTKNDSIISDNDANNLEIDTDSASDTENTNNTADMDSVTINRRVLRRRKDSNSKNDIEDIKYNGPVLRSMKETKDNYFEHNKSETCIITRRVSKSRKSSRDSNSSQNNIQEKSESCTRNGRLLRNDKGSLDDNKNDKGSLDDNKNDDLDRNRKRKSDGGQIKKESENHESYYTCNCKELYQRPAPRSFRKWQVRNNTRNESYDVIVHSAHKLRDEMREVIVEPTPEYQIELGVSELPRDKIKQMAVSLLLHKNTSLVNVRIDGQTGNVVMYDNIQLKDITQEHPDVLPEIINSIHTVFDQLQGLMPDHYVLYHEPQHGANALLYVPRHTGSLQKLQLQFNSDKLADTDESSAVLKPAPVLVPTLMPYHKFRKILPCAFTPYEKQVAKETKKPPTQQHKPPQAIKVDGSAASAKKWPKKKKKSRKNKIAKEATLGTPILI